MKTLLRVGAVFCFVWQTVLVADLTIDGIFEVWAGGTLNTDNENIYNNNTLMVSGGTVNIQSGAMVYNGYDGAGTITIASGSFSTLYVDYGYIDLGV